MEKIPRPVLLAANGLLMLIVMAVVSGAYAKGEKTAEQSAATEIRVTYLEKRFDKFEDKLDKIGFRLGVDK